MNVETIKEFKMSEDDRQIYQGFRADPYFPLYGWRDERLYFDLRHDLDRYMSFSEPVQSY